MIPKYTSCRIVVDLEPAKAVMTTKLTIASARKRAEQCLLFRSLTLIMVAMVVFISFMATSVGSFHQFSKAAYSGQAASEFCENNSQLPSKGDPDHTKHRCCSLCATSGNSDEWMDIIAIIPLLLIVISTRLVAEENFHHIDIVFAKAFLSSSLWCPRGPPYSV